MRWPLRSSRWCVLALSLQSPWEDRPWSLTSNWRWSLGPLTLLCCSWVSAPPPTGSWWSRLSDLVFKSLSLDLKEDYFSGAARARSWAQHPPSTLASHQQCVQRTCFLEKQSRNLKCTSYVCSAFGLRKYVTVRNTRAEDLCFQHLRSPPPKKNLPDNGLFF